MIVFDMAGTAIDENNVVYKTLQKAINETGYDFTLDQVLAEGAGKEKLQAIKDILSTGKEKRNNEFANAVYKTLLPFWPEPTTDWKYQPNQARRIYSKN